MTIKIMVTQDEMLDMRKDMLLEKVPLKNMIYLVRDTIYLISKSDISMLDIEEYTYEGTIFGIPLYCYENVEIEITF